MSVRHVIRDDYFDGMQLDRRIYWCGRLSPAGFSVWSFSGAQHALDTLRESSSITPCKLCLKAMRKLIDRELAGEYDPVCAHPSVEDVVRGRQAGQACTRCKAWMSMTKVEG